jgi:acyl-CoA hydrolase
MKYITSTIVRTPDLALNGNLFGVTLLKWCDEYGGLFCYKYLHHIFVTYKMGDTYFLKSAKLGELIDFYVDEIKYNKISVEFKIIAKLNETGKEILRTAMTFVSIDIDSGKAVILNPFKFEKSEFEKFIHQKVLKDNPAFKLNWQGNLDTYRKTYVALMYLDIYKEKAEAILRIQKDWGKIIEPSLITDIIGIVNKQGEENG